MEVSGSGSVVPSLRLGGVSSNTTSVSTSVRGSSSRGSGAVFTPRTSAFVGRVGVRILEEERPVVPFEHTRVPHYKEYMRIFNRAAPDGTTSSRQGHFLSLGKTFLQWRGTTREFVRTALRVHFVDPALRNTAVGRLFPESHPSPHAFAPSCRAAGVTTPRIQRPKSRFRAEDTEVDLSELWTSCLQSCGQDCAAFWKVCQVVNMLLTLNRERPDRMPASGEGSLESRFAEVYYLLGLMCTDKKDEDEL